ncbi:lantibiotic dehydratase [Saccharothrix sp. Mg75]|uniref:lantibiotic dehydratase n=1 Tax=Saccharothrix sp. Mg75 TaxID=3445357 RepID=UPI003EEFB1B4
MYRLLDAALLRSAVESVPEDLPACPDLTGSSPEHLARWREWIRLVWGAGTLAAAVEVASPILARRAEQVLAGRPVPTRELRSLVLTLVRYRLRGTSRATPFGLFAGVAPARFGPRVELRRDGGHRAHAQVDAEWLATVVRHLETMPGLRPLLPVTANNLLFVRDGRLVIGCRRHPTSSSGASEISVRHTEPVQTAVAAAATPIRMNHLIDKLAAGYPSTPRPRIEAMLASLVEQGILLTSLYPPMTATNPLGHVLEELRSAGVDDVPEIAHQVLLLRDILADLSEHERADTVAQRRIRAAVSTRITSLGDTNRPIAIDLRLGDAVTLPAQVAREAEKAAAVLARLTPYPSGPPVWRDYHGRFVEHYGLGAVVPLIELVHADTGLGFPSGYRDSRLPTPPSPSLSDRDVALLALAQTAALEHRREVVLDDPGVADLAVTEVEYVQPHTELRFRIHAADQDALAHGDFDLAIMGVSRAAGTTIGRFLHLLDPANRARMITGLAALPTAIDEALPVQVSCPPLRPRAENITRHPVVLPHIITLGEHHGGGERIAVDDLVVTADATRLYLMSRTRRRVLEPTVFSAVEFVHAAHPLLRFLCEISAASSAACVPFSWGAAERLPFLPRVRYRRTILSPARWRMTSTQLSPSGTAWPQWADAVAHWRHRFDVPDRVYVGEDDRRVLLHLDDPAHLHLLRADLDRTGHVTLREAAPSDAFGWHGGRAHEIAVPLATCRPPQPAPPRRPPASTVTTSTQPGHLPGDPESGWLYAKLYVHPDRHTGLLTDHLPRLWHHFDDEPPWWFIRYQDPQPHLRLRIRLPRPDAFADTARSVGSWADELHRLGLLGRLQLDTYHPEIGRFGDGPTLAAAEAVFAADSAAAVAQLTAGTPHPHSITAASLVDLTVGFTGSRHAGLHWLIDHVDRISTPALARDLQARTIRLCDPAADFAALRTLSCGDLISARWRQRRTALASYRDILASHDTTIREAAIGMTRQAVLPDLLRLHCIRVAGVDRDAELACLRLARAAALSWINRGA